MYKHKVTIETSVKDTSLDVKLKFERSNSFYPLE